MTVKVAALRLLGTALWCHYGKAAVPILWFLIRDPNGKFDPQALLCTDMTVPLQMLECLMLRWIIKVTEARAHLGVDTNRPSSDLAIARTTPLLFARFSRNPGSSSFLKPCFIPSDDKLVAQNMANLF